MCTLIRFQTELSISIDDYQMLDSEEEDEELSELDDDEELRLDEDDEVEEETLLSSSDGFKIFSGSAWLDVINAIPLSFELFSTDDIWERLLECW
mmetsp:Transcript_7823/g.11631  ORF Transcript_7823/g.11631 Transcript_7823/m.11631 type:complete len:95 (+) Transcript_7823:36-320(+)